MNDLLNQEEERSAHQIIPAPSPLCLNLEKVGANKKIREMYVN